MYHENAAYKSAHFDEIFTWQAVYFYQTDSRGPCLAFEGEKLQLHWFRGYLIIVGKENKSLPRPVTVSVFITIQCKLLLVKLWEIYWW